MVTASVRPTARRALPLLAWLIPYDHCVISSPLEEGIVRSQLAAQLERLGNVASSGWFSTDARYEGRIDGNTLIIDGPIANRRFRLTARGDIRIAPAGTTIDVTFRLATTHLLFTLGQVAFLWIWALVVHFPIFLVLFLTSFLYIATTLMVKYEAAQIVQHLLQNADPVPSPEARGAIVADGAGWRCAACGGYVRRDAIFCKHCKQPFTS